MERLACAEDREVGMGDSGPLTDNLRARMMSELEKWPQLQEAIACSREQEKEFDDRPELLCVDLLIFAGAHIALSEALLLDSRLFVSLLRESIAVQGIRQRVQVRPVMRASASNLAVMFSGMPSGLREVVDRVTSLQSQEQCSRVRFVAVSCSSSHKSPSSTQQTTRCTTGQVQKAFFEFLKCQASGAIPIQPGFGVVK